MKRKRKTRRPRIRKTRKPKRPPYLLLRYASIERWAKGGEGAAYWEDILFQWDDIVEETGDAPECRYTVPLRGSREAKVEFVY